MSIQIPKRSFVFDVESIGLAGEGFSFGYVVIDDEGVTIAEGRVVSPPIAAKGAAGDRSWVAEHVPYDNKPDVHSPYELRQKFANLLNGWNFDGVAFVSDCGWPVEARFLHDVLRENSDVQGPYPLHDLATMLLACGMDPLANYDRLPNELPKHDPLADARQSARMWWECLQKLSATA